MDEEDLYKLVAVAVVALFIVGSIYFPTVTKIILMILAILLIIIVAIIAFFLWIVKVTDEGHRKYLEDKFSIAGGRIGEMTPCKPDEYILDEYTKAETLGFQIPAYTVTKAEASLPDFTGDCEDFIQLHFDEDFAEEEKIKLKNNPSWKKDELNDCKYTMKLETEHHHSVTIVIDLNSKDMSIKSLQY